MSVRECTIKKKALISGFRDVFDFVIFVHLLEILLVIISEGNKNSALIVKPLVCQ